MTMNALSGASFVLEITLKSILLAGAVLLVTWFMRRSSAAQRHLYLAAAVIALLLLPLSSIVLPSWNVDLLSDPFAPQGEVVLPAAEQVGGLDQTSVADRENTARVDAGADRTKYPGGEAGGVRGAYPWLLAVWIAGAVTLLGRLLGGKLYGNWISRRVPEVKDDRVLDAVRRVSHELGYAQEIRVAESDRFKVPFVCGLFRPGLIIPSQVKRWSIERIEAILRHEFAHIKRRDILLQFFAQLACCLYWTNPLAWVLERKLFIERERACDDVAINRDIKASDYAGYLIETMEELGDRRTPVWVTSAMAEGTDFKDRIISVLDPVAKRTSPRVGHRSAVLVLSIALLIPFSSLHPWAAVEPVAAGDIGEVVEPGNDRGAESSYARDGVYRSDGWVAGEGADPGSALGVGDRQAGALTALLEGPDARMREHAATALGQAGNRRAVPALIGALGDEDASVREHVATALGEIGDRRAVLPLAMAFTHDPSPRVREHAATALGQLGDERALPHLIKAVRDDPDARVREHAASAIGMVGGKGAFDVLVQVYGDDRNARVRAHGAYGLGLLKDHRAFDPLVEGLDSRHAEIRAHCAQALGQLGDRRAIPRLKRLLSDSSPQVREWTRRALEMLGE